MTPLPISVPLSNPATPVVYQLQGTGEIDIKSIVATYDGSAAATDFYPVISIYSSDDRLLSRTRVSVTIPAGGSGVVTFAPFLRQPVSQGAGNLNLIYTRQLLVDAASIAIPSIPQTYRNLELVCAARTDRAAEPDAIVARFNADSGTNYQWQQISWPSGSATVALAAQVAQTAIWLGECATSLGNAGNYGTLKATIAGYTLTGNFKTTIGQFAQNKFPVAEQVAGTTGGTWLSGAAITRIDLFPAAGTKFKAGSQFSLYGL